MKKLSVLAVAVALGATWNLSAHSTYTTLDGELNLVG